MRPYSEHDQVVEQVVIKQQVEDKKKGNTNRRSTTSASSNLNNIVTTTTLTPREQAPSADPTPATSHAVVFDWRKQWYPVVGRAVGGGRTKIDPVLKATGFKIST